MKQVLIQQGKLLVEEVPSPQLEAGCVLVKASHSCISIGTEKSSIESNAVPLWKRAFKRPDQVKKVLQSISSQGISKTLHFIEGKLAAGQPTGYSASGTIIEVGKEIRGFSPGDRVACAGAQCAYHAEVVCVPQNLVTPIPENIDFKAASTVALGAIALQGVRRAQPTLGETFTVIGLGLLGQLTLQMLKANGCRVIGIDLDQERLQKGLELGLDAGLLPQANNIEQILRLTNGIGADGVLITAASSSDEIVSHAFQMCRKKGRVVLVGDVGLHLKRNDFYQKEIDFLISSSYGPGRYDPLYEEKGLDYPIAFVRWTENRNMMEYLRLISENKIKLQPLISKIYPIDQASEAYESLKDTLHKPLVVLLSYPHAEDKNDSALFTNTVHNPVPSPPLKNGQIRIALIGAGSFAKDMHLPNLQALSHLYHLQAVMSRAGHNASAVMKQFRAAYATTDYQRILADSDIELVLICTRHHLHAQMALQAIQAGKHVLVEKPLALSREELDKIQRFYTSATPGHPLPILLTGFNRRFSPIVRRVKEYLCQRTHPLIINYRMNAGYIPLDHWVHTEEGGGRNLGEACHIYDLFTYLIEARVAKVRADSIRPASGYYSPYDNFVATVTFQDGSMATLTYTALGSKDYPKEHMEIFVDGKVVVMEDYKRLTCYGDKLASIQNKIANKGQKEELEALASSLRKGTEWPTPLWQQIQAMEIALQVEEQLKASTSFDKE